MKLALPDFGNEYRNSASDHLVFKVCPRCRGTNWKTYLNMLTGGWDCKVCGASGFIDLPRDPMRQLRAMETLQARTLGLEDLPEVDLPDCEGLQPDDKEWLEQKYAVFDPERFLLARATGGGRILIPWPRPDGSIIYWQARARHDEVPKYMGADGPKPLYVPKLFYGPNVAGSPVLVEGPFDALSIASREQFSEYMPIALGGKSLSASQVEQLKRLVSTDTPIRICLDSDALQGALTLRRKVAGLGYNVRICLLPAGHDPADAMDDDLERTLI